MHRYQILIEYVGTNFIGWQIQSKGQSIQKVVQIKMGANINSILSAFVILGELNAKK